MNRSELVSALAEKTQTTKAESEKWLSAFCEAVVENIGTKDGVRLLGFGTFTTAHRNARTARNPQTGAEIQVPARNVPVFRPSSALKESVNEK